MYAVLRTVKLKTGGNIGGASGHNLRSIDVPNVDPKLTPNNIITGSRNAVDAVNSRIELCYQDTNSTPRTNAVRAVETILTASPEFFESANSAKIEKWRMANIEWAEKTWGVENIIQTALHLDEETPHLHIITTPIVEGKLNCREILGGRAKLTAMQTSYADAMKPFGLERGLEGSKARHITPKQFNASKNKNEPLPKAQKITQLVEESGFFKKERTVDKTVIPLTPANKKSIVTTYKNQAAAIAVEEDRARARSELKEARKLADRDSANRVRDIPLTVVADELGLVRDKSDRAKYGDFHLDDHKGVFNNFKNAKGGKGAIDLVMQAHECEFKDAMAWLKGRFGEDQTADAVAKSMQIKAKIAVQKAQAVKFLAPKPVAENLKYAVNYLVNERKIDKALVQKHVDAGTIYADKRRNVVFLGENNAELVGTGKDKFKGLAVGSDKSSLGFVAMPIKPAVNKYAYAGAVESGIDALSFAEINKSPAVSSAGAPTQGFFSKAREFASKVSNYAVAAFDSDSSGDKYADSMQKSTSDIITRKKPPAAFNDWNQNLVHLKEKSGSDGVDISLSRKSGFRPR